MNELIVFVIEPSGRMLWTNATLERITGFTLDDFQYEYVDNPYIHPDDLAHVQESLAAFGESDSLVSPEFANRFITKWGDVVNFRFKAYKMDWDGKVAFRIEARHIRPGAPMDEAARSEARYRSLVDASPDGILRVHPSGEVYYSNRRFQEMVGLDPVALKKVPLPHVFHNDDVPAVTRALESARNRTFEARMADGDRWVEVRVVRTDHPDDAELLQVILRDVTEARTLEHQLRHAQKLESLGVLAGGIAHDFNNLLTAMLGSVSLAEDEGPRPEIAEHLADLRLAIDRAAKLTRSMLTYSGHAPVEWQVVDLGRLIQQLLPLVQAASTSRIAIELDQCGPIPVKCDEAQLTQVLLNLMTNAAEAYGDAGGLVQVDLCEHDGIAAASLPGAWPTGKAEPATRYACITVRDRGPGIDDETLARIFDPFFSTKSPGRGLGLSTVLGTVRGHKGTIGIVTGGSGTTFHVLLPLAEEDSTDDRLAATPGPPSRGGTVLFVDDEPTLRDIGSQVLRTSGYLVTTAPDGTEALRMLRRRGASYLAVVLDETMPGLSGAAVLAEIRKTHPRLPVLRTSGFALDPKVARVDEHTHFLPKPFGMHELLTALSDLLTTADRSRIG